MPPTIAVISAGAMGASVAGKLVKAGCQVLTHLDGRSESTRKRAIDAGMKEATMEAIANDAEWVLSILPPSDALSLAEKLFHAAKTRKADSFLGYADCNAVSPQTVQKIATIFEASSVSFVDGGIIGGPPKDDYNPTFYASSNDTVVLDKFKKLSDYGLKVSPLEGNVGAASALKMSYAGITKGTTALFTTMILAANAYSPATATALLNEMKGSQKDILQRITRAVPSMVPKAYRWVGEMEEIAEFIGRDEAEIYTGISKLYSRIKEQDDADIKALQDFVEKAK